MELYVQQGSHPGYRCCYFETDQVKYLAEMTDLNQFIRVLIPLPTILHTRVEIFRCNDQWQPAEQPEETYHMLIFSEDNLKYCIQQFASCTSPRAN